MRKQADLDKRLKQVDSQETVECNVDTPKHTIIGIEVYSSTYNRILLRIPGNI